MNKIQRSLVFLAVISAFPSCGSPENVGRHAGRAESSKPAIAPVDTTTKAWTPPDYWEPYRTVFVRAIRDSTGNIKQANILYSYASPAETDSILQVARNIRLDPSVDDGRLYDRPSKGFLPGKTSDLVFILPFYPHKQTAPTVQSVTRKELVRSGLRNWLSICDDVLPEWPVEKWESGGTFKMYEYPPQHEVDDRYLMAMNMVSISPDATWGVHPFYDVGFNSQGKPDGLEADSGFVLYRRKGMKGGSQHVAGTSTYYFSAEWIDSKRYILTGYCEMDMDCESGYVRYHAPFLDVGHVDSLDVHSICGPPIPVHNVAAFQKRLSKAKAERYPEYLRPVVRPPAP